MDVQVESKADVEAVARVAAGDTGAFATLYEKHVNTVTSVVRHNVRDRELAADIVQDVFARALASIGNLREPSSFRAWLLSIARHMAIDAGRKASRSRRADGHAMAELEDSRPDPLESAQLAEVARLVRRCVARLSPRDATAISLVADLGFTPVEVAAALGVSRGAAKVVVHRARRRLLDLLTVEVITNGDPLGRCPELSLAFENGDAEIERHARSCPKCRRLAMGELQMFAHDRVPPTHPLTDAVIPVT
jgi:RNA polymerase sigma-70 factor (ECF subfamily)